MAEYGFKMSALFRLTFSRANKYGELDAWQCLSLIKEAAVTYQKASTNSKILKGSANDLKVVI